jgi:hypothetical protein
MSNLYTLLHPPFSAIEPGWEDTNNPSVPIQVMGDTSPVSQVPNQYTEYIDFQLPVNQVLVEIPFQVIKANANITDRGLRIYNTTDDTQITVNFNIVYADTSKLRILLSAYLDTVNYYIKGLVSVVQ